MNTPLIYVWIGAELPFWAKDALKLSQKLCGVETILLTNRAVENCSDVDNHLYIEDFYEFFLPTDLVKNDNFRDGFWTKTLERFLVLRSFMRFASLKKIFHAELDNIIFNIADLSGRLDSVGSGLFSPRDSESRGIASLIYINNSLCLDCFTHVDLNNTGVGLNDMTFLGLQLQFSKQFFSLPTENSFDNHQNKKWKYISSEIAGGIFDAASLGQYLFGIDHRNTFFPSFNGFINENSGAHLKYLNFEVDLSAGVCEVRIQNNNKRFNVYNIHVHSKIFEIIKNHEQLEMLINRINNGKKTLVKKSFGYGL